MALQAVESELREGNHARAEELLISEWDRLGPAEVFYQVIRNGCVPMFELLLRLGKDRCSERESFQHCSNARAELINKNVPIPDDLEIRLLYESSLFGLFKLRGNPEEPKAKYYLIESIDLVRKWVGELRARTRWYQYSDVDDWVMIRIRMIHNRLYFIKDHPSLKQLPLKEMIFCLALFFNITQHAMHFTSNDVPEWVVYRAVLNKRNIVQYLVAISFNLGAIKDKKSGRKKTKKLIKAYRKVKQAYSIFKILHCTDIYEEFVDKVNDRDSAATLVTAINRFIQIIGEATKSTTDSPNVPMKLHFILSNMFKSSFLYNSKYRNMSCHGFSLSQLCMRDADLIIYYVRLIGYVGWIAQSLYVLSVYTLVDFTRHLYGVMRRCRTTEELRQFVRYAGGDQTDILLKHLLCKLSQYLGQYQMHLEKMRARIQSTNQMLKWQRETMSYFRKVQMIDRLHVVVDRAIIPVPQIAAFACSSVKSIHCVLDGKLADINSMDIFFMMSSEWNALESPQFASPEYSGIAVQSLIYKNIEVANNEFEERKRCREIFQNFMYNSPLNPQTLAQLEEKLNNELAGYYQDIFAIDAKAQAITKTLKPSFTGPKLIKDSSLSNLEYKLRMKEFRQRNSEFELKLKELRKQDKNELQQVFQRIIGNIQKAFIRCSCDTFDKFVRNLKKIPCHVRLAIEYWQLQAMEILISSGYFGDNFSVLTTSIASIWGKSYRNYLAHDSISYNLLTYSCSIKALINGFVLAWNSDRIDMFAEPTKFSLEGFVRVEEQAFDWIKVQQDLIDGAVQCDDAAIRESLMSRAEITGSYLQTIGCFFPLRYFKITSLIAHKLNNKSDIERACSLLSAAYPQNDEIKQSYEYSLAFLLNLQRFENIPIQEAIDQFKLLEPYFSTPYVGTLLTYFAQTNNFPAIKKLLSEFDESATEIILSTIFGSSESGRQFLEQHIGLNYNFSNGLSEQELNSRFVTSPATCEELWASIKQNDLHTFEYIITECFGTTKSNLGSSDLNIALNYCCKSGRLEIVRRLLEKLQNIDHIEQDSSAMSRNLIAAVDHRQWSIAKLLLVNGADPLHNAGKPVLSALVRGNFKLVRQMLGTEIPDPISNTVLQCTARLCSLRMLKFLLNRGMNLWKCSEILEAALQNKRDDVFDFLEKAIFKPIECVSQEDELSRWLKTMKELKILAFLTTAPDFVPSLVEKNLPAAERLLEQIAQFLCIENEQFAEFFHFEDTSELFCTKVHPHKFRELATATFKKSVAFIEMIENIPTGLLIVKRKLDANFVCPEQVFTAEMDLTLHSAQEILNFNDDFPIIILENHQHLADAISLGLRTMLLQFRYFMAATCDFTINGSTHNGAPIKYRYIQISSSSCIIQQSPVSKLNFGFLMNLPTHSVFHALTPDVSEKVIRTVLRLGADPTLLNSRRRSAFHMVQAFRFPVSLYDLMYQHCIAHNKTHLPDGTHILDLKSNDGLSPLHASIHTNNYEITEYLLKNGANPTVEASTGLSNTALEFAILNRNERIVRLLLDFDPTLVNNAITCLDTAVKLNQDQLVRLLLEHGADLYHRNDHGFTVIKTAIDNVAVEALQVLLDFADKLGRDATNDVTGNGTSAMQIAKPKMDQTILRVLVCHSFKTTVASLLALIERYHLK